MVCSAFIFYLRSCFISGGVILVFSKIISILPYGSFSMWAVNIRGSLFSSFRVFIQWAGTVKPLLVPCGFRLIVSSSVRRSFSCVMLLFSFFVVFCYNMFILFVILFLCI